MAAYLTPCHGAFNEHAVLDAFARQRLAPHRWSNRPGDVYASHSHGYHKVLFCLRGSITFSVDGAPGTYELHPGDRLDIEPNTPHAATVGPHGVTCVEAAR